jgi:hypothetical protein
MQTLSFGLQHTLQWHWGIIIIYRIAGNFHGVQFSRMASLQSFRGLIFADASDHALYNRTYFTGLIFADSRLSTKTAKIEPHKNFALYSIYDFNNWTTLVLWLNQASIRLHSKRSTESKIIEFWAKPTPWTTLIGDDHFQSTVIYLRKWSSSINIVYEIGFARTIYDLSEAYIQLGTGIYQRVLSGGVDIACLVRHITTVTVVFLGGCI